MPKEEAFGFIIVKKGAKGSEFLLVRQLTNWSFPKGHPEGEETEIGTARRELFEECGLEDISIVPDLVLSEEPYVFERNGVKTEKNNTFFVATTFSGVLHPQPIEILECRYASFDEALNLFTYESQKSVLKKAREALSQVGIYE
jgi:8-oxo-dGTP pyrophosphatase MutT (NUDIX family)